jgi:large subunit ribosomal protein L17
MSELVMHGRIKTTEQKAKSIKSSAEKLITKAQKETLLARKLLGTDLVPEAIEKVITDIAPKFSGRNGGYTRIIRLGRRFNDDASMVLLEWVEGVGQVVRGIKVATRDQKKQPTTKKADVVEAEVVAEKPAKKVVAKKKETTEKKKAVTKKKSPESGQK